MSANSLLIFNFNGARFALDATRVRETVWLPELSPLEEAPPYMVGIFSLRGQLVPVIDLNLRFGHLVQPYHLSDQIVVFEWDNALMGLIVSEVCEVVELIDEIIQSLPEFDSESDKHAHLVAGDVRVGDEIVTLLDTNQLTHHPSEVSQAGSIAPAFYQQTTPEDHAIYRARAKTLMEATVEEDVVHLSLAVVELGGEYFAIELQTVQEFCDIPPARVIPCCPPHILGVISLRGNLLTLLDIRTALNLPSAAQRDTKAVIARLGEQLVGIAVDKLNDVLYLREDALQIAPEILREQHSAEIKGTVPYAGKMIAVLDLPALLARHEWIVSENV